MLARLGLFIGFLFFLSISLFSQTLRPYVALVTPKLSDEARTAFKKIADSFASEGYDDSAAYLRGWAEGGHGSGVLVKDASGKVFLVTNRHVASFCETADVAFLTIDGAKTVWPDCRVLYVDPLVDIAFLEIPQNKKVVGLPLLASVSEGEEVWSAGYPGLIDRPEWQLAKGTITNASVVVPELGKEKDSVYYQHSASIDPGNSGGPLIVGDPAKPETVQVVGINTWSARGRNSAFFAIPSGKLQEALQRFTQSGKPDIDEASQQLADFLNQTDWDKFAFLRYVSYRYASAKGWDAFQTAARTMSAKDRSLWYDRFFASPLDGLSQYLSYSLWQRVRASSDDLVYNATDKKTTSNPIGTFTLGKKKILVTWVLDAAQWKVQDVEFVGDDAPKDKTNTQRPDTYGQSTPEGSSLRVAGVLPLGDAWNKSLGISIHFQNETQIVTSVAGTFRFGFSQDSPTTADHSSEPAVTKYNFLEAGLGLNYYYTMRSKNGGYLAPFVGATANLDLALPMFQSAFYSSLSGSSGPDVSSTFLAAGVLEPRAGVEFSFDDSLSFGVDTGLRWFVFGLSGVKSLPLGLYIKSTSFR